MSISRFRAGINDVATILRGKNYRAMSYDGNDEKTTREHLFEMYSSRAVNYLFFDLPRKQWLTLVIRFGRDAERRGRSGRGKQHNIRASQTCNFKARRRANCCQHRRPCSIDTGFGLGAPIRVLVI